MKRRFITVSPDALCRLDEAIIRAVESGAKQGAVLWSCFLFIFIGSACYGAAFGCWRSGTQAVYSAIKFPVLIVAITLVTAVINTMLALVQGCRLSLQKTITCMSVAFATTSLLLGALSPVAAYLSLQCPASGRGTRAMPTYHALLLIHTAIIGMCGIVGNIRLYHLLCRVAPSRQVAERVLATWIIICAFIGCELSWISSPFLARPDLEIPFFNPNAFKSNFFEYSWNAATNLLTPNTENPKQRK